MVEKYFVWKESYFLAYLNQCLILCINIKLSENHYKPLESCTDIRERERGKKEYLRYTSFYIWNERLKIIIHITFIVLHLLYFFKNYIYYFSYFDQMIVVYEQHLLTKVERQYNMRQYFIITMNEFLPSIMFLLSSNINNGNIKLYEVTISNGVFSYHFTDFDRF